MNIVVVGTGYVGLVTGTCFAELGNQVVGVDIDPHKIERLQRGEIPLYEPGLEELVRRNQREGRLTFTTDFAAALPQAEIVFNAVGTPLDPQGAADLSAVYAVVDSFANLVSKYTVLVNKSTVPVGTGEALIARIETILKKRGRSNEEATCLFSVVSNPEFLREGAAVKDFLNPDRLVVGISANDTAARAALEALYRPLTRVGRSLLFTDLKSAETIKYAANAFLATKISFINEIAQFCERSGANVRTVAKGIGLDARIGSKFLHAGIGYGGSCFPKDIKALLKTGESVGYAFQILGAVEAVNERQKQWMVDKVLEQYPTLQGKTLAVWGLTFKPRTDDMREAPSLSILPALVQRGARLKVFDPVGMDNARALLGDEGIEYVPNRDATLEGAEGLLILTEWDEFRGMSPMELKKRLKKPLVIDGRNLYEREDMEKAGLRYIAVGS